MKRRRANYRKFRSNNNVIHFVEPRNIESISSSESNSSIIGPSTTLIIGKNNSGKTTIANALKLLCNNSQPKSTDFNIDYLSELHDLYISKKNKSTDLPKLEFIISAKVDTNASDLMTNLIEFSTLNNTGLVSVSIIITVEISENTAFNDAIEKLTSYADENKIDRNESIILLYGLLDQSSDFLELDQDKKLFKIKYYDINYRETKKFSLKELINLREIKANRHLKDGVLTEIFNRIVGFQFDNDKPSKVSLENKIKTINDTLTDSIESKKNNVSSVLNEIGDKNKIDLDLKGNITYESLVKNLIKYNFSDSGDYIPESQFGLGYINLLNIAGEIIHYVDSYKKDSFNSTINLLFIEEPEAFMHPQMQEFFINRIDKAVQKALSTSNKNSDDEKILNCQIAITTHSSHIVNSKIHSSNSFNNINYLTVLNKSTNVVNLNDLVVSGKSDKQSDDLKFIKKHIKYKVSELFFSDAIIFVEGATEESLLQYYIEQDQELRNHYISIFNINGAHGKVYLPLAKELGIPCLIITDIDIKRSACQKNEKHKKEDENCQHCGHIKDSTEVQSFKKYIQIDDLSNLNTTNETIVSFFNNNLKEGETHLTKEEITLNGIDYFTDKNIHLVFQKEKINNYYATSLEEAFILTNFENKIINNTLKVCKPKVYKSILGSHNPSSFEDLKNRSYEIQRKLSKSKSDFSSELLYQCIISDDSETPSLPKYINDGFNWLKRNLNPNSSVDIGDN